jgi:hypothetical protein
MGFQILYLSGVLNFMVNVKEVYIWDTISVY